MTRPMKTALILLSAAALLVGIALPAAAKEAEEQILIFTVPPPDPTPTKPPPAPPATSTATATATATLSGGGTSGGDDTSGGGGGTSGSGGVIQCWTGSRYVQKPLSECAERNRWRDVSTGDAKCTETRSYSKWTASRSHNGRSEGEACHRAAVAACKAVKLAAPTSGTSCGEPTVCVITKTSNGRTVTISRRIETTRDAACNEAARMVCFELGLYGPISGTNCGPTMSPLPAHCTDEDLVGSAGDGGVGQCRTRTVYKVSGSRRCLKYARVYRCIQDDDGTFDCAYFYISYRGRCPNVTVSRIEECICSCPRCAALGGALSGVDGELMSRNSCEKLLEDANHSWGISCEGDSVPTGFVAPCRRDVRIGDELRNMPC